MAVTDTLGYFNNIREATDWLISHLKTITELRDNVIWAYPVTNFSQYPVLWVTLLRDNPDWRAPDTIATQHLVKHVFAYKLILELEFKETEDPQDNELYKLEMGAKVIDKLNTIIWNEPYWCKLEYANINWSQTGSMKPSYVMNRMELDLIVDKSFSETASLVHIPTSHTTTQSFAIDYLNFLDTANTVVYSLDYPAYAVNQAIVNFTNLTGNINANPLLWQARVDLLPSNYNQFTNIDFLAMIYMYIGGNYLLRLIICVDGVVMGDVTVTNPVSAIVTTTWDGIRVTMSVDGVIVLDVSNANLSDIVNISRVGSNNTPWLGGSVGVDVNYNYVS